MIRRTTCLLLAALVVATIVKAQPRATAKTGTVEIVVADTFGDPVRDFKLEIRSDEGKESLHKTLRQSGTITLPYGYYVLNGSASLHSSYERAFKVRDSHLLLLVAFAPVHWGESNELYTSLAGRVVNLPASNRNWVRVVSVFGSFNKEAAVNEKGNFEVPEVPDGEYFVAIMNNFKIVAVQRFVKTVQTDHVLIDIKAAAH